MVFNNRYVFMTLMSFLSTVYGWSSYSIVNMARFQAIQAINKYDDLVASSLGTGYKGHFEKKYVGEEAFMLKSVNVPNHYIYCQDPGIPCTAGPIGTVFYAKKSDETTVMLTDAISLALTVGRVSNSSVTMEPSSDSLDQVFTLKHHFDFFPPI